MTPQKRALLQIGVLVLVVGVLALVFPKVLAFVELGARELRYLWWLVVIVALGAWLIWGLGRKTKE